MSLVVKVKSDYGSNGSDTRFYQSTKVFLRAIQTGMLTDVPGRATLLTVTALFEHDERCPEFSPEEFERTWKDILSKSPQANHYQPLTAKTKRELQEWRVESTRQLREATHHIFQ